jgi:hypothetical protein
MLTIRAEQFEVFSRLEVEKFEEWMIAHLRRFFPQQCAVAGEAQLRETIQGGIKRAAAYGMTAKRDVCKYIDLMIVLGRDFDTDNRYPWAGEILSERRDPSAKMQALHGAALKHPRRS